MSHPLVCFSDLYGEQQDHFLRLAEESSLQTAVFDTSQLSPEEIADKVAEFWAPDWPV